MKNIKNTAAENSTPVRINNILAPKCNKSPNNNASMANFNASVFLLYKARNSK